jgi:hypothetical protein
MKDEVRDLGRVVQIAAAAGATGVRLFALTKTGEIWVRKDDDIVWWVVPQETEAGRAHQRALMDKLFPT